MKTEDKMQKTLVLRDNFILAAESLENFPCFECYLDLPTDFCKFCLQKAYAIERLEKKIEKLDLELMDLDFEASQRAGLELF